MSIYVKGTFGSGLHVRRHSDCYWTGHVLHYGRGIKQIYEIGGFVGFFDLQSGDNIHQLH